MYYTIQTAEMSRIMEHLHRVLKMQITFFDLHEIELDTCPDLEKMSPFCRRKRQDPAFLAHCIDCDRRHLEEAKRIRSVHLYHCHAGLLEGIVPLYNRRGLYLGSIVFGQVVDPEQTPAQEWSGMRRVSMEEMNHIGHLLKYLGEYICENELVKQCAKPWSVQLEEYVERNLNRKISLSEIGRALGKSTSFLSHNIPKEFGMPLKACIRKKKMEKARRLLLENRQVNECAFELGYADEFYFSRDFKLFYGYPPKEMKKQRMDGSRNAAGK